MRKILLLMLFLGSLTLYSNLLLAQEKTISGKVTGDDNLPLKDVTVTVKGTKVVTKTDANGFFSIKATDKQVIVFTFVNYKLREVSASNSSFDVKMSLDQKQLDEVVVTAMDIKRNPKELGYSVQKVDGEVIKESQRDNWVNSLQGRVAGLTVLPTGGAAGSSSQVILRGFNSLSLDNSPLYVIDGIVADNNTFNETSNGGSQLGLASDRPNRQNDYSNRISDINPNDIASITVLKGPEATALYGSQASSGAIIITTRRAKTDGKLLISYDNSFKIETLTRLPEINTGYSSGTNGVPASLFTAFGPLYDGGDTLYNNLNNFFETGFSVTNNLSLEYGKKNASFRFTGAALDMQSPIPTNTYKRYNFRLSNVTKIGKYVEISPAISYVNTINDKPLRGASGYLLNLLVWPTNNDIRNWETADGLKIPLFGTNPNADLDNPFYNVYKNRSSDKTNRFIASMGVDINPTKWLTISGRFGYDTYKTDGYTTYDSMSFYLTRAQKGQQDNYYRSYYGYNQTITATAKKTIKDFSGRIMIGQMWQDYENQQYAVVGTNIVEEGRTDSNNTDPATRIRLSNAKNGLPNYSIRRQSAFFGEITLGWKTAVYLTYSHRFEESSIFPEQFRQYNYPAASMSIILSDLIPGIKSDAFNYWKLRGSLASTARTSSPYANQSVFNNTVGSGGGYAYAFNNNNPLLEPEIQKTFELGTELRFNNNRISVDATYYNTRNEKLIVENFRASYATGYVLNTLNVGANQNQGVEIAMNMDIINNNDFKWNSRINFNKMWNEVTELPANVPEFYISDTWVYLNARGGLVLGGPTTTITSYGYKRNNAGEILISPTTGLPQLDNNFKVRGDRNPDFTIGFANTYFYKAFRFSFLWDLKVGGDIFNATDMYLTRNGRSYRTIDRTNPRVIDGIIEDGMENTKTPTRNNISVTPYRNQAYYTTMPEEEFIEKNVNWLRLRDISMYYNFGAGVIKSLKVVQSLAAFATINNLILITNYTGADPEVSANTSGTRGVGGYGFDYGNVGSPIAINLGFKVTF